MKEMTLSQVESATGGSLVCGGSRHITISGVTTDSRGDLRGKLFVPLKGARNDGHDYINAAFENGAAATLSEGDAGGLGPVIRVDSTARALCDLAMYYKSLFSVKTVAVTGSVGKTSTKDMTASVLSRRFRVLKTEGNYNNEIGLPLTVFRLDDSHEYAVFEMGMNHFGEIRNLSRVVKPDICLITNIGESHIEYLGSREGILKAKSEIFEYMSESGAIILNGDDDMLLTLKHKHPGALFYGLNKGNDIYANELSANGLESTNAAVRFGGRRFDITVPLPGEHMLRNALAAASVGILAGLAPEDIRQGLLEVEMTRMRLDISKTAGGVTVINDAYNASPASMKAAIDILALAEGRKVCVLGDMFELGEAARMLHEDVGRYAAARDVDLLIFAGSLSLFSYESAVSRRDGRGCHYFGGVEAAIAALPGLIRPGDTVLVKASRGMAFEGIVDRIFM